VTSDDGQQGEEFSTTELVTLLHERLDNKSRRVARAMQFNIVAATVTVSLGQLQDGAVTIPVNTTLIWGGVSLFVSFVAGFAGLAAVGHPLTPADAYRDRQSTAPDGIVAELRRRNRFVAGAQSVSFGTGALGVGLLVSGVVRSLGVTTNRLPLSLIVGSTLAVVFVGHALGHLFGRS
jgi:hypothetical protein